MALVWWHGQGFAADEQELESLRQEVKRRSCRVCRRDGTLNCHGWLRGQDGRLRGARFWCSPRRRCRPGCGATFSVWLSSVRPRYSVGARQLGAFYWAWFEAGGQVLSAWASTCRGFSTDSAYRWIGCLKKGQGRLRVRLSQARAPPPATGDGPLAELFGHLEGVLGRELTVSTFQQRFQEPWPMS